MENVRKLLAANSTWAEEMRLQDPEYFERLTKIQTPKYLWIGCSDSRVPANQITGLPPGEVFVHRNIANVVQENDLNALAVIQYAVDILKVTDIIVCGHYGCGGVKAAADNFREGIIGNWLSPIRDLKRQNREELDQLSETEMVDRLCELNVQSQAEHVARTVIVEDAWNRGQRISVHSWVYRLDRGILQHLCEPFRKPADIDQ